jgi:hypothetical protein
MVKGKVNALGQDHDAMRSLIEAVRPQIVCERWRHVVQRRKVQKGFDLGLRPYPNGVGSCRRKLRGV